MDTIGDFFMDTNENNESLENDADEQELFEDLFEEEIEIKVGLIDLNNVKHITYHDSELRHVYKSLSYKGGLDGFLNPTKGGVERTHYKLKAQPSRFSQLGPNDELCTKDIYEEEYKEFMLERDKEDENDEDIEDSETEESEESEITEGELTEEQEEELKRFRLRAYIPFEVKKSDEEEGEEDE